MPGSEAQVRAFDGLIGTWRVENRLLRERLAGSADWISFEAVSQVSPILDGLGNVERFEALLGGTPFVGINVRIYDPVRDLWTLRWADNRSLRQGRGGMETAFEGGFDADGAGRFAATLDLGEQRVVARFTWTGIGTGTPRWEQAWAPEGDGQWEPNWTMVFRRG